MIAILVSINILGCGGTTGPTQAPEKTILAIFNDPTCVCSNMSISVEQKAYSANNLYYAKQIEYWIGKIGIYTQNGTLMNTMDMNFPAGQGNALRGMAWSRDNKYIVVMYHRGDNGEDGLHLFDATTGAMKGELITP